MSAMTTSIVLHCAGHALPPLPPGSVPSFTGLAQHTRAAPPAPPAAASIGDEAEFEQQLAAARASEEQEPLLQQQQQQQRRTWADGDSSDEDEALDQVTTLRRISNAAAGSGSSAAGGGSSKPGSRRATAGNAPAVTTAEEARKASRAGKKLPSTKLQELLAHSSEPIAAFLRETYDVTAYFVSDEVDLEVMQRQYKRWQRAKAPAAAAAATGLSIAGGALSRSGAAVSGAGGLAGPEASAAALQLQQQQGPRLAASLAGAGLVAAEASHLAVQAAAVAAAGLPAVSSAAKRPLSGEEVAVFGFKFVQQPEHTIIIIINPCKPYHFGIGTAPHPP
jgi:hypothetical protein